jgi:hypothetical protein
MKKFILVVCLCIGLFSVFSKAWADPGDYALRGVAGPSFNIDGWEDQMRVGGEFAYDLGYSMNLSLLGLFGLSDEFRFQLIPGFSYNYMYLGPAVFHALVGVGYGRLANQNTMDMRFSTGVRLPLNGNVEAYSDINFFVSPLGTPGTPRTFDWLLGVSFNF